MCRIIMVMCLQVLCMCLLISVEFRGLDRLVGVMLARTFSKVCSDQIVNRTQRSRQRSGRSFALYHHCILNLFFDDGTAVLSLIPPRSKCSKMVFLPEYVQICATVAYFFEIFQTCGQPKVKVKEYKQWDCEASRSIKCWKLLVAPDTCFQGLAKRSPRPFLGTESIRHSASWHSNRTHLTCIRYSA